MSNTFTKGYDDGAALTESQLDTGFQTLQLDIANTALMTTGSSEGQALISNGSAVAASFQTIPDPQGPFALRNYGLKATVATGVMTISLTTKAGTAPSGTDKVDFNYSTNGTTSATYSSVQVSAATTFTLNASATLGYTATSTSRIHVYGYYNTVTGSVKLAVSAQASLDIGAPVTTTAVSASADSMGALYASAALTVVPRLLGWINAAHTSAGLWQTPSKVNITNQAGRNVVISSSSGSFSTTSSAATDVTNLSVSIATTGRPVWIGMISDGSGFDSYFGVSTTSAISVTLRMQLVRDSSAIGYFSATHGNHSSFVTSVTFPSSAFAYIDSPAAGSYTYKVQFAGLSGSVTRRVEKCKLVAYEL